MMASGKGPRCLLQKNTVTTAVTPVQSMWVDLVVSWLRGRGLDWDHVGSGGWRGGVIGCESGGVRSGKGHSEGGGWGEEGLGG